MSVAVTIPLAHVDLGTLAFPSTTTETEYAAVRFMSHQVPGGWTSDHSRVRLGTGGTVRPTAAWLRDGREPPCPTLAVAAWTTTGGSLFPAPPATIETEQYEAWHSHNQVVYRAVGVNELTVVVPAQPPTHEC